MENKLLGSNVVLVTNDEKSGSYKWENNSEKIKAIDVISSDYGWVEKNIFQGNEFIGLIPNTEQVFLKSPFEDNKFIEIEKAEDYFFKKKISIYKNIIFALGAKDFSAKAVFIEEKKITLDANLNVSYKPIVNLETNYKEEITKKIESEYLNFLSFEDNPNNIPFDSTRAYIEAKSIIKKYNLTNEDDLVDLVEFRNPNAQKKLTKETVKLRLTSELNTLLELSAKISTMGSIFELEAGFKSKTESLKKIILETEVNF